MAPPISFIPKYNQPFTLEQAMMLEIDLLVGEIRRLENSIEHLRRTQDELIAFLLEEPDEELSRAKDENDDVIASQKERITLIKVALLNKVGEGGVRHYGLDPMVPTTPASNGTTQSATPSHQSQSAQTSHPSLPAHSTPVTEQSRTDPTDPTAPLTDGGVYL